MSENKNKRNVKIEIIRLIACFAVIWYHIRELPFKSNGELSETAVFFECICTICVMTFFLITGFFIYNKKDTIISDWIKLLKKTFINIFIPFVMICIITLIFHEYLISRESFIYCLKNIDIKNIFDKLLLSFKTFDVAMLPGTAAHLWYIYSYIIIILVYPISRFILTKLPKQVSYIIILILTICMIINDYYLFYGNPTYNIVFKIIHKPIYYTAVGFVLYNDVIKKYIDSIDYDKKSLVINKKIFITSAIIYTITFVLLFITQVNYYLGTNNGYVYTSWLSLYSLLLTVAFILIIYNINIELFLNEKIKNIIYFLSGKTLGIYLVHYLIITKLISIGFQNIWTRNRPNILFHFGFYIFYSLFVFILSLLLILIIDIIKRGLICLKEKII
ncbi:MAG: acyltransferase [Lachnospiraceae bacterium]|nr:acyltransferase [Lachnospiraceae bacterium]